MAVVEDTVPPPPPLPKSCDGMWHAPILVQSGLLVANSERPKEYWCLCQQVCTWSAVVLKL